MVKLAADKKVFMKSSLGTCTKLFVVIQVLNLTLWLYPFSFSLKNIWLPIALFLISSLLTHSKILVFSNWANFDLIAFFYYFK